MGVSSADLPVNCMSLGVHACATSAIILSGTSAQINILFDMSTPNTAIQDNTNLNTQQNMIAGDNVLVVTVGMIMIVILMFCCIYDSCCVTPRHVHSRVVIHNDFSSVRNILPRYENPPTYEHHHMHEVIVPPPDYAEPTYPSLVVVRDSIPNQMCSRQ